MNFDSYLETGAGLLGAFLSWFFGGLNGGILVLATFMIIDQITGVMKGYVLKRWSSDVGFHGISKKVCMFLFVGIANIIDKNLHIDFLGHSDILRDFVICFYVANEGLSIIENAIELDAPVPHGLKEHFMSWRNKQLMSKNSPGEEED
ncbi:MAG: phage holin family protein [Synergistaceae bacterium]|nr:phage holin family protein [Synergistaceae bacterium]